MKLLGAIVDPATPEARAKSGKTQSGKTLPGQASADQGSLPFPEVLSDLGSAPGRAMSSPPIPALNSKVETSPSSIAATPSEPLAFFEVLVAGAAILPASPPTEARETGGMVRDAKGRPIDGQSDETVDHLLKRIAKGTDEAADPSPVTFAQPEAAMLAMPSAAPVHAVPLAATAATHAEPAAEAAVELKGAGEPTKAASPATSGQSARISDVAITTQFVPVAPATLDTADAAKPKLAVGLAQPASAPPQIAAALAQSGDARIDGATPASSEITFQAEAAAVVATNVGAARTASAAPRATDVASARVVKLAASPSEPSPAPTELGDASNLRPADRGESPSEAPAEGKTRQVAADERPAGGSALVASGAAIGLTATATPGPTQRIAAAISGLAAQAPVAAASAAPVQEPSTPRGIARTLTLQMSPADLGTVAIKMHMSGNALDVQLTMSESRTAGLVDRERGTLTALLQDQRYELHSLVIQDGSGASQPGGHHASQGNSSGGQAPAQHRGGDQGADARPRREPSGQQARREPSNGDRGRRPERPADLDRGALVV